MMEIRMSDYISTYNIWIIDVGLWPDGSRYETSIGLYPASVKFYYRIIVKYKASNLGLKLL